jgi:hypothetical protein
MIVILPYILLGRGAVPFSAWGTIFISFDSADVVNGGVRLELVLLVS